MMVYELEIKNPKGGTKKVVLASVHCRIHLQDQGEVQSGARGGAAYQNAGAGGLRSMQTRDGGDCDALSPAVNLKKGQAAAKVCWV